MSQSTTFKSTEALRSAYKIDKPLFLGEPSYVQFIKHPILAREYEDSLVDVQVGSLSGDTYTAYPELAEQADSLYEKLEHYLEFGDHDGLLCISLIHMGDEGYRIVAEPNDEEAEEHVEFNAMTLDELLKMLN